MKTACTLFTFALLLGASSAQASCNKYSCEGVSNVVFSSVIADSDAVKIKFHEGTNATLSCNLDADNAAVLDKKSPNFRNMQSMLLTAIAANLPIGLSFNSASPSCSVQSVEVKVVE
ncbi:hypothetical protein [Pseudoalteromonas luteoviolacea]|uniref:Uncharacterized protein n=1 Tax=Pseudoalteromonas luteoviolacea S4054 TaxID=1129367 RepID=A0A0F6AAI9_9GAMM|nr:hypothetical protein [Pseudoalteromonas luteoviolacea]AOT09536.1 hypothetical protein S4054249_17630 [Pseudoalteromonas luteoviolacea]AOT14448.1 hypothetical protein S40542_17600 [Pseudoalteromonas luteoviolacea]AOT19364.1 hypothetical protein S4054_17605 [Pseudoalteromonas luteoviolacea]KKE83205.1 hypothetical protein N479_15285 [Pseudoalteromonas luteoviolacea S4054]KZN68834.1 hypothetical protein N481_23095 [Pseudoalteromonas luteoviolacea S4047-1]